MPFDFDDYQKRCSAMTTEQLNQQWDSYTRQIAAGSTSTANSILLAAFTGGVSLVGLGFSAPRIHNARKKRQIIQASLEAQGKTHHTHAKDVLIPMTIVGVAGGVSLGLGASGVDLIPASGAMAHLAVDCLAPQAAASSAMTYFKYKATEAAKKTEEDMFEAGIQLAHTWPQGPAVLEKHGPLLPPMLHSYSAFGHSDVEGFEEPFIPMSQPNIPLPVASSAQPNDQNQDVRSFSLPMAGSMHNIPRKPIARTQSDVQKVLQSTPVDEKPAVIDGTIQQEIDAASAVTISDAELDDLVAVLTDDEQLLLLMKLELELRNPGGLQPLRRSKAVHISHGRMPHIKHHDEGTASQSSETELTSPSPTSHSFSVQLSDDPGSSTPAVPTRHNTLPLRPSRTSQQPPLPPRAPSLPVQLDTPNVSATLSSNPEIESSQILRKPLFMSPQQSYTAEPVLLQPQPPTLKDQRKDSGYYSASSTPSMAALGDVSPSYSPPSFSEPEKRGSQSSISSASSPPPPPYSPPPSISAGLTGGKGCYDPAAAPNTIVSHDNDHSNDIN